MSRSSWRSVRSSKLMVSSGERSPEMKSTNVVAGSSRIPDAVSVNADRLLRGSYAPVRISSDALSQNLL